MYHKLPGYKLLSYYLKEKDPLAIAICLVLTATFADILYAYSVKK